MTHKEKIAEMEKKWTNEEVISLLDKQSIVEIEGDEDGIMLRPCTDIEGWAGESFVEAFRLGYKKCKEDVRALIEEKLIPIEKEIKVYEKARVTPERQMVHYAHLRKMDLVKEILEEQGK